MNLYINGTGLISAAGSNTEDDFLAVPAEYSNDRLQAKEPDYTGLIPPMQLRRMSKAVRMSVAAAASCLRQAGMEKADAISVGTAMGCLYDTEQFLSRMVTQQEQMLTPTSFIQSTHNTVGGQIALLTGCQGHNLTFVHRGHSFEQALINAQLYLNDHPGHTMLAGGTDELTDTSFRLMQRATIYKQEKSTPGTLYASGTKGSLAGEGAAFFSISLKPQRANALQIRDLHIFHEHSEERVLKKIRQFLDKAGKDADLVVSGKNGDVRSNAVYDTLERNLPKGSRTAAFKHLTGDFATSGAIALGIITDAVLNNRFVPQVFGKPVTNRPKKILLINNFLHHYSCMHLETV